MKYPLECGQCGRDTPKAKRVYKGLRYCANCYGRIFRHRLCSQCGNLIRLPINESKPICQKCTLDKPCVRCNKETYRIGKLTEYGPVCASCARYFKKPENCDLCGELSFHLARNLKISPDQRLCPKCRRKDFDSCQSCRRYRVLKSAPDGQMLCNPCLEDGSVKCLQCGQQKPAGYGKVCQECYWQNELRSIVTPLHLNFLLSNLMRLEFGMVWKLAM